MQPSPDALTERPFTPYRRWRGTKRSSFQHPSSPIIGSSSSTNHTESMVPMSRHADTGGQPPAILEKLAHVATTTTSWTTSHVRDVYRCMILVYASFAYGVRGVLLGGNVDTYFRDQKTPPSRRLDVGWKTGRKRCGNLFWNSMLSIRYS